MTKLSLALLSFGLCLRGPDARAASPLTPSDCDAFRVRLRLDARSGKADLEASRDAADRCAALPGLKDSRRAVYVFDGARLRLQLGDPVSAEKGFKRALRLKPKDAAAAYGLAEAIRERPQEALRYAELAARAAPTPRKRAAAHRLAAELRLDLGDAAGAQSSLERALKLGEDDLDSLEVMVRAKRGRPQEAFVYALRASSAAARAPLWLRPSAYRLCSRIWRELDERAQARECLKRALALDAHDLDALEAMVPVKPLRPPETGPEVALAPEPRTPEDAGSRAAILRALQTDPDDLDSLRRLIAVERGQGRLTEAAALAGRFMDSVSEAPAWQHVAAYMLIAQQWLELGDRELAAQSVRHARNLDPRSLPVLTMAQQLGVGDLAADDPTPADAHVHLARARADLDDAAGAEQSLKRALESVPDHLHALKLLAQLKLEARLPREALAYSDHVIRVSESEALKTVGWEFAGRYNQLPWEHASLYNQRAQIEFDLGDEAAALKSINRALGLVSEDAGTLTVLIDMFQRRAARQREAQDEAGAQKSGKQALVYWERLLKASEKLSAGQRAGVYARRAKIEAELKDPAGAQKSLKKAVALDPEHLPALEALAQIEQSQGRLREALAYCDLGLKASEKGLPELRAGVYARRAAIERALGDAAGAAESLKKALELVPDHLQALLSSTQLALDERRPSEALAYCDRALKASRKAGPVALASLYNQRARIALELGDAASADRSLKQALELIEGDASALQGLVDLRLQDAQKQSGLGDAAGAMRSLEQALKDSEKALPAARAALYNQKARLERQRGDAEGAQKSLRQALALDPRDLQALISLTQLEQGQGRPREALAACGRALEASADAPPSARAALYNQKAQLERELGDAAGAGKSLKQALALAPADPQTLAALTQLELAERRPQSALAHAQALVEASEPAPSRRAAAFRQRAQVRLALGDEAAAREDFARALAAAPEDLET